MGLSFCAIMFFTDSSDHTERLTHMDGKAWRSNNLLVQVPRIRAQVAILFEDVLKALNLPTSKPFKQEVIFLTRPKFSVAQNLL